jgi:hypothetical protein
MYVCLITLAYQLAGRDITNEYSSLKVTEICETSGSHGRRYEDGCVLACCAVYFDRIFPTFQRCILPVIISSSLCFLVGNVLEDRATMWQQSVIKFFVFFTTAGLLGFILT